MTVSVLLPTLNEESNLLILINEIKETVPEAEIIVIDGLSTDNTVKIANSVGVKVMLEKRKGKGIAIKKAFDESNSDYVIMLDADCTYPVKDIPKFLEKLEKHDVVMGSRFKGHIAKGAMSVLNNFGNYFLSISASVLYLKPVSDVCTGMWGFSRKAYKNMNISAQAFELEANLFSQAIKKKFSIAEIPIDYFRRSGKSKVRLTDGFLIFLFLLRERFSN